MGTVIMIASGKGGTGKTSFCAGVGVALCALGEKVLAIDFDAGMRNLDLALGMTDRLLFSYADVIAGHSTLKNAAAPHPLVRNLRVLTAPVSPAACELATPEGVTRLIALAREHFSYVLLDCPAGLTELHEVLAGCCDRAAVIATPDNASLRGAQTIGEMIGRRGAPVGLVVNRLQRELVREGASHNIDRSIDIAGLQLLGCVPEDRDVPRCHNRGEILMLESVGAAQAAYTNIARRLCGRRVPLLHGIRAR